MAVALLLDTERFMSLYPRLEATRLASAVALQILFGIGAIFLFFNAVDHHQQTNVQALNKERERLQQRLGQGEDTKRALPVK